MRQRRRFRIKLGLSAEGWAMLLATGAGIAAVAVWQWIERAS